MKGRKIEFKILKKITSYILPRLVLLEYGDFISLEKLLNGELDGVYFINDVGVNYFNSLKNSWRRIGHTRDIVRPHTPVFYFRKNSILTWMFDRKIEIFNEAGLTMHWIAKYQPKQRKSKFKKPTTLKISGIITILEILIILFLLAFLIFLMEIFAGANGYIRKVLEYLTY